MKSPSEPADRACEVLIAGAGLAGLTRRWRSRGPEFDVVCCGAEQQTGRGRTVALLDRSVAYLKSAGSMDGDRARGGADARACA